MGQRGTLIHTNFAPRMDPLPKEAMDEIPPLAKTLLAKIPPHFYDDGCSNAPDGYWKWACRIHDWWWCTRAHPRKTMTPEWKELGDVTLRALMVLQLPRWLHWLAKVYYKAVNKFGGSYNTCGFEPEGATQLQRDFGLCRHSMPRPHWMKREGESWS